MIYHITNKKIWETALKNNSYKTESFVKEGFIHCSPKEKIPEVLNNFYKGEKDLLLLCIDETKVKAKIVWEDLYNHDYEFPHIYGELNLDAISYVMDFNSNEYGLFVYQK